MQQIHEEELVFTIYHPLSSAPSTLRSTNAPASTTTPTARLPLTPPRSAKSHTSYSSTSCSSNATPGSPLLDIYSLDTNTTAIVPDHAQPHAAPIPFPKPKINNTLASAASLAHSPPPPLTSISSAPIPLFKQHLVSSTSLSSSPPSVSSFPSPPPLFLARDLTNRLWQREAEMQSIKNLYDAKIRLLTEMLEHRGVSQIEVDQSLAELADGEVLNDGESDDESFECGSISSETMVAIGNMTACGSHGGRNLFGKEDAEVEDEMLMEEDLERAMSEVTSTRTTSSMASSCQTHFVESGGLETIVGGFQESTMTASSISASASTSTAAATTTPPVNVRSLPTIPSSEPSSPTMQSSIPSFIADSLMSGGNLGMRTLRERWAMASGVLSWTKSKPDSDNMASGHQSTTSSSNNNNNNNHCSNNNGSNNDRGRPSSTNSTASIVTSGFFVGDNPNNTRNSNPCNSNGHDSTTRNIDNIHSLAPASSSTPTTPSPGSSTWTDTLTSPPVIKRHLKPSHYYPRPLTEFGYLASAKNSTLTSSGATTTAITTATTTTTVATATTSSNSSRSSLGNHSMQPLPPPSTSPLHFRAISMAASLFETGAISPARLYAKRTQTMIAKWTMGLLMNNNKHRHQQQGVLGLGGRPRSNSIGFTPPLTILEASTASEQGAVLEQDEYEAIKGGRRRLYLGSGANTTVSSFSFKHNNSSNAGSASNHMELLRSSSIANVASSTNTSGNTSNSSSARSSMEQERGRPSKYTTSHTLTDVPRLLSPSRLTSSNFFSQATTLASGTTGSNSTNNIGSSMSHYTRSVVELSPLTTRTASPSALSFASIPCGSTSNTSSGPNSGNSRPLTDRYGFYVNARPSTLQYGFSKIGDTSYSFSEDAESPYPTTSSTETLDSPDYFKSSVFGLHSAPTTGATTGSLHSPASSVSSSSINANSTGGYFLLRQHSSSTATTSAPPTTSTNSMPVSLTSPKLVATTATSSTRPMSALSLPVANGPATSTVTELLSQLKDMHDSVQTFQKEKWDAFLRKRRRRVYQMAESSNNHHHHHHHHHHNSHTSLHHNEFLPYNTSNHGGGISQGLGSSHNYGSNSSGGGNLSSSFGNASPLASGIASSPLFGSFMMAAAQTSSMSTYHTQQDEEVDDEDLMFWASVGIIGVATLGKGADWEEFRDLVRGGIPVMYRNKVWYEASGAYDMRQPGRYQELLSHQPADRAPCFGDIEMDLHRTFPTNILFGPGGTGIGKLQNVLVAYSLFNPAVGYCQGMNLLAGTLLMINHTEEEAFWILASILGRSLPQDYFTQQLLSPQADQRALNELVQEIMPRLSDHLIEMHVDLTAITFSWFLTLFTDCLPVETMLRVWDVFFVEGMMTLFKVAMALLWINEKDILKCRNGAEVYCYMKQMTLGVHQVDKLMKIALVTMKSYINIDKLEIKRQKHHKDVRMELAAEQLAMVQKTAPTPSTK